MSINLPSLQRLSIFGRTFLLMFAALLVAEGIGIALQITRPPLHQAPVSLVTLAALLQGQDDSFAHADVAPGPPPGAPPPDRPTGGDPLAVPPSVRVWVSSSAPGGPRGAGPATDSAFQKRLTALLGAPEHSVRLFLGPSDSIRPPADSGAPSPVLREGFLAALQLADGRWRIVENPVEPYPNAYQRQAIYLFGLGIALLLPLAWFFARALSAPILRFSEAAKRLGSDPAAPALVRAGPAEMRDAVDSFNNMQTRLNRLLQERTQMMGAIAHDLRTPLTRLAFRLEDLPSGLREKVSADIQEMKMMIASVLEFIRDRSLAPRRERLDFRLLVESVVDDLSDLGYDVNLQPGAPITLQGDPIALKRAIVNLIDNALKYGERARVRVQVTDAQCILQIDDDGPGIAPEFQDSVFEPFFRVENSRNRDTGGIGLGLAAVRSIVLDHGGEVRVQNRKEGGLRATVSLPIGLGG